MCFAEPSHLIDLSLEIFPGAPAFPGDPACAFEAHDTIATAGYNLTRVCLGTHQGTHLDVPWHFFDAGETVDQLDLVRCVGPATVFDLSQKQAGETIEIADLLPHGAAIQPGARLLLRFGWDRRFPSASYFDDYPGLSAESARWLAERRIALLGMDTPGPSAPKWKDVHLALLEARIVVVEALANLDRLPREVFFAAAPLKLRGLDGSPVRAFAVY